MQNIDPIFILEPVIAITLATGFLLYWYFKRRFHPMVIVYSLIAYAVAIALKYVVQIPTINIVINAFGQHSIALGVYYGLQTVFFEVGLAFVVAWYTFKKGVLDRRDAEGYGAGLAFWENAGYIGILTLIDYITYYSILSSNSALAQTLYNQLSTNAPGLFAPAAQAFGSVALSTVERVSSILFHFAWGYLCVMAVVYRKKILLLIALPMGFVDFLVPFASGNIVLFEAVVFALSVISVIVAWYATKKVTKNSKSATAIAQNQD